MAESASSPPSIETYLKERWADQQAYFERKATANQTLYMRTRVVTLVAIWLTPISIAGAILYPPLQSALYDFIPLVLSSAGLGSYQWEELYNYGAKWAKFRLVAERLKGHRELFLQRTGMYRDLDDAAAQKQFVEFCEGLIEGTDVNYFILMVDPRRRDVG
jgi:hypothetical protein